MSLDHPSMLSPIESQGEEQVPAPALAPTPAPFGIGPNATKQQRLAWIVQANHALITWYVRGAFNAMPPLVSGALRGAGRMLGVDVEAQAAQALYLWFAHMPPNEFQTLWTELARLLVWCALGVDAAPVIDQQAPVEASAGEDASNG